MSPQSPDERKRASSADVALQETWQQLGIDPETIELRGGTAFATRARDTVPVLPDLLTSLAPNTRPQLELGEVLGEGGMGMVRVATQTALEREVAVKVLHDESFSGDASDDRGSQLLREGRVIGLVEHPNVVPVHNLGQDRVGRPLLVMKRIEGTVWSSMLCEASPAQRASSSYLQRHVQILRQIAAAVDFAHARGILHRDIKPDNVMLGPFNEVYLVDWGIAVSVEAERLPGVPAAAEVRGIEGTPGYLSPEMAKGNGALLGIWSDIYLLGATLHHVITGEAPHQGTSLLGMLYAAHVSKPPEYDAHVPDELADVARRAMAPDPEARFTSARELGQALDAFLTHRGSLELCEIAERRAAELGEFGADHAAAEVEEVFHEARFGFEQALRTWPENQRAREGREAVLEHMAARELERGAPQMADALLRRCEQPSPALVQRVADALALGRAKEQRLASLERDIDLTFGRTHRIWMGLLSGFLWATACFACGALTRYGVYAVDHDALAGIGLFATVASVIGAYAARAKMLANTVNRLIAYATILVFALGAVLVWMLGQMDVSLAHTTVIVGLVSASVWITVVFALGPARLPFAVGSLLVSVGAWFWPTYHFEIFGLLAVPLVITMYFMSTRKETGA